MQRRCGDLTIKKVPKKINLLGKSLDNSMHSSFAQNMSMSRNLLKSEIEYDSDEIKHHCHSDVDEDETDPYFEYNKCENFEFLEKKIYSKREVFIPINLNPFLIKVSHKLTVTVDLLDELDKIIKKKYLTAMKTLLKPIPIFDQREEKTFATYAQGVDTHLLWETHQAQQLLKNPSLLDSLGSPSIYNPNTT